MINLPEIVIILVIVVIVFGVGKVGNIGAHLRGAKKEFKKGLEDGPDPKSVESDREVIDITPSEEDPEPNYDPKPGTRRDPVEDAEIETNGR